MSQFKFRSLDPADYIEAEKRIPDATVRAAMLAADLQFVAHVIEEFEHADYALAADFTELRGAQAALCNTQDVERAICRASFLAKSLNEPQSLIDEIKIALHAAHTTMAQASIPVTHAIREGNTKEAVAIARATLLQTFEKCGNTIELLSARLFVSISDSTPEQAAHQCKEPADAPLSLPDDEDILYGQLRVAIGQLGRDAKPDAILTAARVNRQKGLAALRTLKENGEYDGFTRPKRKRYAP